MADTPAYVVVDHILKSENEQITEQNTFNVSFTNLVEGDRNAIADWIKEDLQYDELKNAPALPPDTNNESPAYETVSGQRKIKGFDEVAFTGSYNDLSDAPGIPAAGYENGQVKDFNPVAFTGITELGNVSVSEILDLRNYDDSNISVLGTNNVYIDNLNNITGLSNAVSTFCDHFASYKGTKPFYIITNAIEGGKIFEVLNAQKVGPGGLDGYYYYQIDTVSAISDYPYENGVEGNGEQNTPNVLGDIEIIPQLSCFIFDIVNNCIYYKVSDNGVTSYLRLTDKPILDASANNTSITGLAAVAISGDYNSLDNKPAIPEVPEDTNNQSSAYETVTINNEQVRQLKSLKEVAFSNDYNDLDNKFYVFNPGEFIHYYDSQNDSWMSLVTSQLELLQHCGFSNGWIKNIHKLYKSEDITDNSIIDELQVLEDEFNLGKICYLYTSSKRLLITNLTVHYSGNNIVNMVIDCTNVSQVNFHDELSDIAINTDNDITNVMNQLKADIFSPIIVIDFNNKILYSQYKRIYPLYTSNPGLELGSQNDIGVAISPKAGNMLQILTNTGEEGLYVSST